MVREFPEEDRSIGYWSAHDVAIYGPGTYTIYRDCPAGCPNCGKGAPITFAVSPEEIGLDVLLDRNTAKDIDLVNVLAPNAAFGPLPLWTGATHANPAGRVWDWMSRLERQRDKWHGAVG